MKANLPLFLTLPRKEQKAVVEALIFAANSDEILTSENIFNIAIGDNSNNVQTANKIIEIEQNNAAENISDESIGFTLADIEKFVAEINEELDGSDRPYRIVNYAGGYQFATLPQYGEIVYRMLKAKTSKKFSNAQLETLSIIAYKQPVTKQEIDRIRGVMSSSEIINILIEKQLIKIAGRKDVIGKPLLYATTQDFLKAFGLNSLAELPKLREIEEIADQKLREEENEQPDLVLNITSEDIQALDNDPSLKHLIIQEDKS